jgi:hypothetical protein
MPGMFVEGIVTNANTTIRFDTDDPAVWGYDVTGEDERFQAKTSSLLTPFSLHLIGEHVGGVTWPHELDNVIHVHSGLDYEDYYELLSTMVSRGMGLLSKLITIPNLPS